MIVTKVMGVVWGTGKQRWPSSASLCRCGVSFFETRSFHFQDVKCKTPTRSQFKNSILIPGRGKSLFCGRMRHCFEVGLARTVLAVLDLTSTIVETQVGGQEEEL